jgi:SAM-dependent methyltransferase
VEPRRRFDIRPPDEVRSAALTLPRRICLAARTCAKGTELDIRVEPSAAAMHPSLEHARGLQGECPLCGNSASTREREIATGGIRAYWRRFDFDLDDAFPGLPSHVVMLCCNRCGLRWFVPSLIGPPALYARLSEWPEYYDRQAWEWARALDILRRNGVRRVLEIGAGTGEFLSLAAPHFESVEGIELSEPAIRTARDRGLNVTDKPVCAIEADYDAVVAFQLLEHVSEPARFIDTAVAKLAHGGILIFAVPNQDGAAGQLPFDYLNLPPHHATRWTRASFCEVARLFGLDLIDYASEPLTLNLYKLYLQRHMRPATTTLAKSVNALGRLALGGIAAALFPLAARRLHGANHLAAFRKR